MCLRPTSETAMYSMFSKWIKTEEDLPLLVQQTCNVFRYETKGTKPLIRVREIPWNEAHTCHSTPQEAIEFLSKTWESLISLFQDTLSVNGMKLRRPEWDKFPGGEFTDVLDVVMPCGRVLQSIGSHYLGQHFSQAFNIKFTDNSKTDFAYMTCIGVSTRALATVLSIHGDDKGLVVPSIIAPYQVIIVPIFKKGCEEKMNLIINEIKLKLNNINLRVQIDLDSSKHPGEKYYLYEMKGVPIRIDFGPKDMEKNQCVLVIRTIEGKLTVSLDNIENEVKNALIKYDQALKERSKVHFHSRIVDCSTLDEVKESLDHGGFAKIPFFTMDKDGKGPAEFIREKTGGEIRGWSPTDNQPGEGTQCIISKNPAKYYAYVARAY